MYTIIMQIIHVQQDRVLYNVHHEINLPERKQSGKIISLVHMFIINYIHTSGFEPLLHLGKPYIKYALLT